MTGDEWLELLSQVSLTTTERQILFLRYYCGYRQREVGEILGRKQQSIYRTEKRILYRLKDHFG